MDDKLITNVQLINSRRVIEKNYISYRKKNNECNYLNNYFFFDIYKKIIDY